MQGFIKISRYAGMRNDLAQAGGGNTSVKLDDKTMLVKSSGIQLAQVGETEGYTKVDYRRIVEYFQQNMTEDTEAVLSEEKGKELLTQAQLEGSRASIETFLHSVTGKYTLHSHPTLVNILTARKGGEAVLQSLFPEAIIVPYEKPGAALAEAYYRRYRKHKAEGKNCDIIFLANHGLVVSSEDAGQVIAMTEEVLHRIVDYLQIDKKEQERYENATKLWISLTKIPVLGEKIVYTSENRYLSWEYIGDRLLASHVWEHAFCPDCVVYGAKKMLFLQKDYGKEDILAFLESYGEPVLICYEKQFYIVAESVKKAQEIENVMSFSARVQMANLEQGMNCLSEEQEDALLNWDSEKYRRML